MICFNPDSSILIKVNICSYSNSLEGGFILTKVNISSRSNCLEGNFFVCAIEDGSALFKNWADDDYDTDCDVEFQEDVFEEIDKETELHEMRSMDIVQMAEPGNVLALFSPPNALELIYSREAASEGPTALHLN